MLSKFNTLIKKKMQNILLCIKKIKMKSGRLREELDKNKNGIERMKKAGHDFSPFNLHGRELIENFKRNGISLAKELDDSFLNFHMGGPLALQCLPKHF